MRPIPFGCQVCLKGRGGVGVAGKEHQCDRLGRTVGTEPEGDAGDTTTGATEGELGDFLRVAIWLDMDKDGKWDTGDKYLTDGESVVTAGDGITDADLPSEAYDYLNDFSGKSYSADTLDVTIAGSTEMGNFRVEYDFPSAEGDDKTQSDSAVFDITFRLSQTQTT